MRIEIPLPAPFFVIAAKDEEGNLLILRDAQEHNDSCWAYVIDEHTKKYDDKSSAVSIMNIQIEHFSELNVGLSSFKVRKIKPIYIFE